MKKILLLLAVLIPFSLFGQAKLRQGYIATQSGDTVSCLYQNGQWVLESDTTFIIKVDSIEFSNGEKLYSVPISRIAGSGMGIDGDTIFWGGSELIRDVNIPGNSKIVDIGTTTNYASRIRLWSDLSIGINSNTGIDIDVNNVEWFWSGNYITGQRFGEFNDTLISKREVKDLININLSTIVLPWNFIYELGVDLIDIKPGSGLFNVNNIDASLVTRINIDDVDYNSHTQTPLLQMADTGSYIYIYNKSQDVFPTNIYAIYQLTGGYTDSVGYTKYNVSFIYDNGLDFASGDVFELVVEINNNRGGGSGGVNIEAGNGISLDGNSIDWNGPLNKNVIIDGFGYGVEIGTPINKIQSLGVNSSSDMGFYADGDIYLGNNGVEYLMQGNAIINNNTGDIVAYISDVESLISENEGIYPFNWPYTFNSGLVDLRPGIGVFKFNNSVLSNVSQIYVDYFDANSIDRNKFFSVADTGTYITILTDENNYVIYQLTNGFIDAGNYYKFNVEYKEHNGSISGLSTIVFDISNNTGGLSTGATGNIYADTIFFNDGTYTVGGDTIDGIDSLDFIRADTFYFYDDTYQVTAAFNTDSVLYSDTSGYALKSDSSWKEITAEVANIDTLQFVSGSRLTNIPQNDLLMWDSINSKYILWPTFQAGTAYLGTSDPTGTNRLNLDYNLRPTQLTTPSISLNGSGIIENGRANFSSSSASQTAVSGVNTQSSGIAGSGIHANAYRQFNYGLLVNNGGQLVTTTIGSEPMIFLNRNFSIGTTVDVINNLIEIDDSPITTGIISGKVLSASIDGTERISLNPRSKRTGTAHYFDTDSTFTTGNLLAVANNADTLLRVTKDSILADLLDTKFKSVSVSNSIILSEITHNDHVKNRMYLDSASQSLIIDDDISGKWNIGSEVGDRFFNPTGTQIDDGKIVRITGDTVFNGYHYSKIELAGNSRYDSTIVLGAATTNIPSLGFGRVTFLGRLNGLNTLGLSGTVYLGNAGAIIDTSPPPPALSVCLGQVPFSDNDSGYLYFNPTLPEYNPSPHFQTDTSDLNEVVTITTQNVYEYIPLGNTNVFENYGFIQVGDSIQCQVPGHYTFVLSTSFQGNPLTETWNYGIFINGILQHKKTRTTANSNAGDVNVPISRGLNVGDWISTKVRNTTGTGDPTMVDISFEMIFLHRE